MAKITVQNKIQDEIARISAETCPTPEDAIKNTGRIEGLNKAYEIVKNHSFD